MLQSVKESHKVAFLVFGDACLIAASKAQTRKRARRPRSHWLKNLSKMACFPCLERVHWTTFQNICHVLQPP